MCATLSALCFAEIRNFSKYKLARISQLEGESGSYSRDFYPATDLIR